MAKKTRELTFLTAKSPYWQMDFVVEGERVSRSTRTADKKEAERIARAEWQAARDRAAERRMAGDRKDMTWEDAVAAYLDFKGEYAERRKDVQKIAWLTEEIGAKTYISQISHAVLVKLVSKRRGQDRFGRPSLGKVTAATVHNTVTALLRRILWHAKENCEIFLPSEPKFRKLGIKVKPRVAELMIEMQVKLEQTAPQYILDPMNFILETGMRREAANLSWDEVFLAEGVIRVTTKGEEVQEFEITPLIEEILLRAKGHDEKHVFTFVAQRTTRHPRNGKQYEKGRRYPMTGSYLLALWHGACRRAGIARLRLHDLRKTHGARIVRETGCIKSASLSLGHARIDMTDKHYSHISQRDVRRRVAEASAITRAKIAALKRAEIEDSHDDGMPREA